MLMQNWVDPQGFIRNACIAELAIVYGLNRQLLRRVQAGQSRSHKGWRVGS